MFESTKLKAEIMTRKVFEKFGMDEKAEAGVFKLVMGLFIVAILVGALIPTAITSVSSANTTGWDAGTIATYNALPVMLTVAVIAVIAGLAYKAFNE